LLPGKYMIKFLARGDETRRIGTYTNFVYLQAYQQTQQVGQTKSPSSRPFFAFVSLYHGDAKVLETPPEAVVPTASGRVRIAPLSFDLELNGLSSGEYDCQITVLDVSTSKTAFWRAPIVIVQQ
jgi:hypothetical protein